MKKPIRIALCLLLVCALIAPLGASVFAADYYMAYNFYGNPDLSSTSRKFDSFMIDFRGTITPNNTYWSLCNFGMYLGSARTKAAYPSISGFGAYCGLQNRSVSQGKAGILSFWEANYKAPGSVYDSTIGGYAINGKKVVLNASRVYPSGSSTFSGEGDGTNCIAPYAWQTNKWYTMLLHSWEDEETGTTFVGEWFRDVETGEWTLFSYFDTHLYDSYLIGGMSQFQENYSEYSYNYTYVRECNLKNQYAYDHTTGAWVSLNTSTLSYGDGGRANKAGAHTFGKSSDADGDFWWGSTGGTVHDQASYEASSIQSRTYTISQPSSPAFGGTDDISVELVEENGGRYLRWNVPATNSPQLGYTVNIYDGNDNLLSTVSATRPQINEIDISDVTEPAIRCELQIESVFGDVYTAVAMSDAYLLLVGVEFVLTADYASNIDNEIKLHLDMYTDNKDVYGFSVQINFNPSKLAFDSSAFGEKFPWARAFLYEEGKVRVFAATDIDDPVSDTARMVDLTFRIIDPGKALSSKYTFNVEFYNNQPAYTLDEERHTVHLTQTKANSLTVTLGYHTFDLNNSGSVTITDVSLLLDIIAGKTTPIKSPDLDNDGVTAVSDVSLMLDFISKMKANG